MAIGASNRSKWHQYSFAIGLASFIMMVVNPVLSGPGFFTTYLPDITGWDRSTIVLPYTLGSVVSLFITFYLAGLFARYDSRKIVFIGSIGYAVAMFLLANMGENYVVYFAGALLCRFGEAVMTLAGSFVLCGNWFNKKLGTVLGIVSIGAPLSNGFLMNGMIRIVDSYEAAAQGLSAVLTGMGIFCIFLAILFYGIIRSKPEDVGLYPDGADTPPTIPENIQTKEDAKWTFRRVFTNKTALCLAIGFGCMRIITSGVMGVFVRAMMETGMEVTTAANYLTLASLMAIPISYISGIIDDKVGTRTATLITAAIFVVLGLALAGVVLTGSIFLVIVAAVGLAFGVGTVPNLHASFTARVFGRKNMLSAHRYLNLITILIALTADITLAYLFNIAGNYSIAFLYCAVVSVLAFILLFFCNKSYSNDYIAAHNGSDKIR